MSPDELQKVQASNQRRLDMLSGAGIRVEGLDLQRLAVMVESLMTTAQRAAFEESWAGRLAKILDGIEAELPKAALLAPFNGRPHS